MAETMRERILQAYISGTMAERVRPKEKGGNNMSLNIGKSYIKVWETEDKDNYIKAKVSSGRKDKRNEGQYINSSWFCRFVGKSVEQARTLTKGDKITILNGMVESVWDKDKQKAYTGIVVFEFEQEGQPQGQAGFTPMEDEESGDILPF